VRNAAQFAARYPGVTVHGVYSGRLDNAGETLTLSQPLGGSLLSVSYQDLAPWPVAPDGFGFSVVPMNANSNPDPNSAMNWRASTASGGSPGSDDPPPGLPSVRINEVLTASVLPDVDAIELFNPTASDANVGGWFLTDDPARPKKFRLPEDATIPAGGFALFDEADFNPVPSTTNNFSLRAEGDDVYLFSADLAGNLTGYSHGFALEPPQRRNVWAIRHQHGRRAPAGAERAVARCDEYRPEGRPGCAPPKSCIIRRPATTSSSNSRTSPAVRCRSSIPITRPTPGD
jgi:hypothetical protein